MIVLSSCIGHWKKPSPLDGFLTKNKREFFKMDLMVFSTLNKYRFYNAVSLPLE
jgi:hypothetical protein